MWGLKKRRGDDIFSAKQCIIGEIFFKSNSTKIPWVFQLFGIWHIFEDKKGKSRIATIVNSMEIRDTQPSP